MIIGDILYDYEMADDEEFIEYYSDEGLEILLSYLEAEA